MATITPSLKYKIAVLCRFIIVQLSVYDEYVALMICVQTINKKIVILIFNHIYNNNKKKLIYALFSLKSWIMISPNYLSYNTN